MNENENEVEDVRDVIEEVMTNYLFELADEKTMKALTKDIATKIHIEDYFDYVLEATVGQDSIVIDLCIKPTDSDEFTYFTGSYTETPAVQNRGAVESFEEIKTVISAYDRAMKSI